MITRIFGSPDPDLPLVRAAQHGDPAAFDRLARRHEPALMAFLSARLMSEEAAREVAQECLLGAWRQIRAFRAQSRFKTWLFGIASHKATDYLRRCAALPKMLALEEAEELVRASEAAWAADPQRLVDRTECGLRVRCAVARLPETQRRVVELYYFADLTLREIAELLKLNLSTLKYQFYQAHRALRPHVTDLVDLELPTDFEGARAGRRTGSPR